MTNSQEGFYYWETSRETVVALYTLDDSREIKILGAAALSTSQRPWNLKRVWAPGNGKHFYRLLISFAGESGLSPCRDAGHVVPAASAMWEGFFRSSECKVEQINGGHLDEWLNAAYFSVTSNEELDARSEKHRQWTASRASVLPRQLRKWLGLSRQNASSDQLTSSIRIATNAKLIKVSDIYSKGGAGYLALARHATRVLGQEFGKRSQLKAVKLDTGAEFDGFCSIRGARRDMYCLFTTSSRAEEMSTCYQRSLKRIRLAKTYYVIECELGQHLASFIQSHKELAHLVGTKLRENPWSFIAAYWSLIAAELGFEYCSGFASDQDIYLLIENAHTVIPNDRTP